MGDMLTQEEINALLAGGDDSDTEDTIEDTGSSGSDIDDLDNTLTSDQKDVLGEVGNISMGTAATTLFTLLNGNKVNITTPKVTIRSWQDLFDSYNRPCVGIRVNYIEGLTGSNVLVLKEHDVKIITDLMMGGDGHIPEDVSALSELELSAIGEAMNQMVGSSSTSLSSVIKRKIDIDTPQAMILDFGDDDFFDRTGFVKSDILACVAFKMEIGDLIDSEITQIIPIEFAIDMVDKMMEDLMNTLESTETVGAAAPVSAPAPAPAAAAPPMTAQPTAAMAPPPQMQAPPPPMGYPQAMPMPGGPAPAYYAQDPNQGMYPPPQMPMQGMPMPGHPPISASPAQFQALDMTELAQQKENIDIIMDVPLEVTVELGRTSRRIKEILEFTPGTVVDLDKLAGEPIDILVNGKFVATGEVVVVDENFAVRVVDIVNVDKRI